MDERKQELTQKGGIGSTNYQAARDQYINPVIINHEERVSIMKSLISQYNEEKTKGIEDSFAGYIKKLERYTTQADRDLLDLPTKLTQAGYETDIDWAMESKENYAKLLKENTFSLASQQIHVFLLAKTITYFNNKVLPALKNHAPHDVIKTLIIEEVINPIEELVGGENVLSIYSDDINGMLYYLTGNCHIKWI